MMTCILLAATSALTLHFFTMNTNTSNDVNVQTVTYMASAGSIMHP